MYTERTFLILTISLIIPTKNAALPTAGSHTFIVISFSSIRLAWLDIFLEISILIDSTLSLSSPICSPYFIKDSIFSFLTLPSNSVAR